MIRKNDNLRKQINMNTKQLQKQSCFLSGNPSHALLLSMNQYRKQITSLAIDCVKQKNSQSTRVVKENKSQMQRNQKKEQKHLNELTKNGSKLSVQHNKTTHTKKKKYNYDISFSGETSSLTQAQAVFDKRYGSVDLFQMNRLGQEKLRNTKNHFLINKNCDCYITKPFVIEDQQNLQRQNEKESTDVGKAMYFQKIKLQKTHDSVSHTSLPIRQRSNTQKLIKSSLNKSSQALNPTKPIQSTKILATHINQPSIYPKTETYTSRSDYDIEKLRNKLDSYIKNHINQPL